MVGAVICSRDMREHDYGTRCPDCGHAGILHPPMARGSVCEACQSLAAITPEPVVWQMRVVEGPEPLRSKYQR